MLRKEAGAYPVNKEDGILYPFVTDFARDATNCLRSRWARTIMFACFYGWQEVWTTV